MENQFYPICWFVFWKGLTRQFFFISMGAIGAVCLLRFMILGGDVEKTFAHVSLPEFLLVILGIAAAIPVFTLLVAQGLRLYSVSLKDGVLHGSGFWGFRKQIPLQDITGFDTLYTSGMATLVVKSRHHGSIHLSDYTARLDDLFHQLCTYLPETEKEAVWQHLPFVLHSVSLTRGPHESGASDPVRDILKKL